MRAGMRAEGVHWHRLNASGLMVKQAVGNCRINVMIGAKIDAGQSVTGTQSPEAWRKE
jgi:hypothetical protein